MKMLDTMCLAGCLGVCLSACVAGTLIEIIRAGIHDDPILSKVLRVATALSAAVVAFLETFVSSAPVIYDGFGLWDPVTDSLQEDFSFWKIPAGFLVFFLSYASGNTAAVIAGELAALLGTGIVKGCTAIANGASQCMRLTHAYDNSIALGNIEKTPLLPETAHITSITINNEDDNNSKDTKKGWMRTT